MTPITLPATESPSTPWQELEPVELGDSTRAYVHLMRVEHRLRAAELDAAIRRAERWYAAHHERLAAAHRRGDRTKTALAAAGAIGRR